MIRRSELVVGGLLLVMAAPGAAQAVGGAATGGERSPLGQATPAEREVLVVVEATFDAMREKDGEGLRRLFHPEARLFSTGMREGPPAIGVTTLDDFIESVTTSSEFLDERLHDPEVRIAQNLASVWAPYTFHRDQVFNHCGIDAIHLIRDASGWKILGIAYTRTRDGCQEGR